MKRMKSLVSFWLIMLFLIMLGCKEEKDAQPTEDTNSDLSSIGDLPEPDDFGACGIDSEFYRLLVSGNNYTHFYQKDPNVTCGGYACLPTAVGRE